MPISSINMKPSVTYITLLDDLLEELGAVSVTAATVGVAGMVTWVVSGVGAINAKAVPEHALNALKT